MDEELTWLGCKECNSDRAFSSVFYWGHWEGVVGPIELENGSEDRKGLKTKNCQGCGSGEASLVKEVR